MYISRLTVGEFEYMSYTLSSTKIIPVISFSMLSPPKPNGDCVIILNFIFY